MVNNTIPNMVPDLMASNTSSAPFAFGDGMGMGLGSTLAPFLDSTSQDFLNATNVTLYPPSYYSTPYRIVGCLFVTIIFIVGFVGNIMVVIVVARTGSMHTPTNCYLVSLAIADVLVLISATLPTIVEYHFIIDQWLLGTTGCCIMVFLQYLGINASSLSITAFTIERYIAICHPMRAQTICTVRRAKKIIAGLWVFSICYNSPWLFLATTVNRKFLGDITIVSCTFKLKRNNYVVVYMADIVIFYVFPLILTCILYGLIARILFTSTIPSTPGKANGVANSKKSSVSSSRVQVIKMLAVVVGMFAVLWMPYRLLVVYNSFATKRYQDYWFMLFCRVMVYMNSAINPILYNAMSVKFRRAFKRLLSCGRKEQACKLYLYSEQTDGASGAPGTLRYKYRLVNGHSVSTTPTIQSSSTQLANELTHIYPAEVAHKRSSGDCSQV